MKKTIALFFFVFSITVLTGSLAGCPKPSTGRCAGDGAVRHNTESGCLAEDYHGCNRTQDSSGKKA